MQIRREQQAEDIERRRADRQDKFTRRQVAIFNQQQDWVENKLKEHDKFQTHHDQCKKEGKNLLKEKAKSTGSLLAKAQNKHQTNFNALAAKQAEAHAELVERHRRDFERADATSFMRLKCGNDVFSFREEKYGTWNTLQQKRITEIKKSREATIQNNLFHCAEFKAKMAAQQAGVAGQWKQKQQIWKDQLTFSDSASAVFVQIKAEPDERKIAAKLEAIGFEMPKLPEDDAGDGEEKEQKPAF